MAEFIIETVDAAYTYTSTIPAGFRFEPEMNKRTANTQGNLRKVQKGDSRMRTTVVVKVSQADYEDTIIPMWEYSEDVNVTFDRNIPGRGTDTGRFTFEDLKILREFNESGYEYEIQLNLVEVLNI